MIESGDAGMAPMVSDQTRRNLRRAAEEHAAMLPVLKEVARMTAWTWLRVQAYYEQQNDK